MASSGKNTIPAPVRIVSAPRSGHHYLVQQISRVVGSDFFCEGYACVDASRKPIQCPGPLRTRPPMLCEAGLPIVKSHDFTLTELLPPRVIVLYRDDLDAQLRSWFQFEQREAHSGISGSFLLFGLARLPYLVAFRKKWVNPLQNAKNALVFEYRELDEKSHGSIRAASEFVLGRALNSSEEALLNGIETFNPSLRPKGRFFRLTSLLLQRLAFRILQNLDFRIRSSGKRVSGG